MAASTDGDDVYQSWLTDFGVLRSEVLTIALRKTIFEDLDAEIHRVNGTVAGGALDHFLRPIYAEAQASIVRRLADDDRRSISLFGLVSSMAHG